MNKTIDDAFARFYARNDLINSAIAKREIENASSVNNIIHQICNLKLDDREKLIAFILPDFMCMNCWQLLCTKDDICHQCWHDNDYY